VPSVWDENAPVVMLEALAHRCPIVCSGSRGMTDLVQNDVNGLTFVMGDARALAGCLRRLVEEPGVVERLRGQIRRPQSSDEIAARIVELYRAYVPAAQLERSEAVVA